MPEHRADRRLHPALEPMAAAARAGRMDRREFLALATSLGATPGGAWALLGAPGRAAATDAPSAGPPRRGGVLRMSMTVYPVRDPRLFDWSEMGNVARQCLEPLVRYRRDFTFEPWLLTGWDVSDDVRTYTLRLREGVLWTDGEPFEAEDVAHNFRRWCERDVPGNSMGARVDALIDPATGRARDGAIEIVDRLTVRLHLSRPDIALIANISEYPALIVPRDFDETGADFAAAPVSTGPFELVSIEPGVRAEVRRRTNGAWWGGEALLDGVIWTDHGPDPQAELAAFAADAIDANYWSTAAFAASFDALGLTRHSVETAATVVVRTNAAHPPYDDPRVRRALQFAVDNEVVLILGYAGDGTVAENHHVSPIHPEYAELPPPRHDPAEARRLLAEAGAADFEHELVSIDDDWRRNTADAVAAQCRDAGIPVRRTLVPGVEFWPRWTQFPFSTTNWNMRPLGVQVLALAYKTGAAWNETGFSDPAFDDALNRALATVDVAARREIMAELQRILRDSGVIIQPYWQALHCHSTARVQGYFKHAAHELHLEDVWLADA
jgi:peptide/nickel transport system substrate-binding protein